MIRDKIVFSISDQRLKERLLRETNLTLEKKQWTFVEQQRQQKHRSKQWENRVKLFTPLKRRQKMQNRTRDMKDHHLNSTKRIHSSVKSVENLTSHDSVQPLVRHVMPVENVITLPQCACLDKKTQSLNTIEMSLLIHYSSSGQSN